MLRNGEMKAAAWFVVRLMCVCSAAVVVFLGIASLSVRLEQTHPFAALFVAFLAAAISIGGGVFSTIWMEDAIIRRRLTSAARGR